MTPESRDAILGDLRAAAASHYLRRTIIETEPTRAWLADNGLSADQLTV
jgi:hypothetical protein